MFLHLLNCTVLSFIFSSKYQINVIRMLLHLALKGRALGKETRLEVETLKEVKVLIACLSIAVPSDAHNL